MLGYHCKIAVGSANLEIFSFSTIELTFHILSGWILGMEECLPGGWM